jgi:hypothetical protein
MNLHSTGKRIAVGLLAALSLTAGASTQWSVINLHPAGASSSAAYGVSDGRQVGLAYVGGNPHASLWSGTAASWLDLHPAGSSQSAAYGVGGGQQVGEADGHASLWSGISASWVDLGPFVGKVGRSVAAGVNGGQQVGSVTFFVFDGSFTHACLWNSTVTPRWDLHPRGASESFAFGVGNGQQVGKAIVRGNSHASLWTGTAASWVDLNPAGEGQSAAFGVNGGQQVGEADNRASLWSGTAASWVDLSPAGSSQSEADGVDGGLQVGYAAFGGVNHAGVWSGTAASFVDLHAFLPATFTSSTAQGIWRDAAGVTYVVGYGYNGDTGRDEALMWVSNYVAPTGFSLSRGILVSGGLADLIDSDDQRMVIQQGPTLTPQESPVNLRVDSVAPLPTVTGLTIKVEAQANTPGVYQWIDLFDYSINDWVNVDGRYASVKADAVVVVPASNPNRFIQLGTRLMRAQIRYRAVGPTLISLWQAKIDQVQWRVTP